MMMWSGGRPAASSPRTIAATTAGRVPHSGPGSEKTLMPTVSFVPTRLRQAAATSLVRASAISPRLKAASTRSLSDRKALSRFSPCTTTTRADGIRGRQREKIGGAGGHKPAEQREQGKLEPCVS